MRIRKGAVAIILRQNEFLVLRRVLNWKGWEFVKGSIDEGEDEETAVRREIREETGLEDIEIVNKFPEKMEYKHPERLKRRSGIDSSSHTVFLVRHLNGEIRLSNEHGDFKWLPYEEARAILTYGTQKNILDTAYRYLYSKKP